MKIAYLEIWFDFREVLTLAVTLFLLLSGLVGLAISYALSVTGKLSGLVNVFAETEKEMVSVERIMQSITDTPKEERGSVKVCTLMFYLMIQLSTILGFWNLYVTHFVVIFLLLDL